MTGMIERETSRGLYTDTTQSTQLTARVDSTIE